MRLIDLNEFRKELFSYFLDNGAPLEVWEVLERIQDCFDNTPTIAPESPQWISVNDKLPEEGQRVLTACEDGVVRINCVEYDAFPCIVNRHDKFVRTTHWMPLPQPPEEGEE